MKKHRNSPESAMRTDYVRLGVFGQISCRTHEGRARRARMKSTHRLHARATALVLAAFVTSTRLALASAEATVPPRSTQTGLHMVAALPASAIEGRVTIRNVRSVERRAAANSEPYQATIAVLDSAGREVAIVQTDTEGRFRLQLSPGTYVLRPQSPAMYPRASEQQVQVRRNVVTEVEIVYDSGKR